MATNHNANLRRCESPRSFEASCSSGITNGTEQSQQEHSGTCNGPNRMQEGKPLFREANAEHSHILLQ